MRWALIENSEVVNVVEQDERPAIDGNWVECGNASPGWRYANGTFTAPIAKSPERRLAVGSFFDRFGAAKWAILADPSPAVQAVVKDASVRNYIDLDNPDLPAGLAILQAAGHNIDPQVILTAPVLGKELP